MELPFENIAITGGRSTGDGKYRYHSQKKSNREENK